MFTLNYYVEFYHLLTPEIATLKNKCIAIIGSGGKTSLLTRLGREFVPHFSTLLTSLTKTASYPSLNICLTESSTTTDIKLQFKMQNPVFLAKKQINLEKFEGISKEELENYRKFADITIFECDGARNLPLKAHNETDPFVPDYTNYVIVVVGADVVNSTITDNKIHRPDLFKSIWNIYDNTVLNVKLVAYVVTDPIKGYRSKIPNHIKPIYFVNKSDVFPNKAKRLAENICKQSGNPTYYGSVKELLWKKV